MRARSHTHTHTKLALLIIEAEICNCELRPKLANGVTSPRPKAWQPRELTFSVSIPERPGSRFRKSWCFSSTPKAGKTDAPAQQSGRRVPSCSRHDQPFCSIQACSWLHEVHPLEGGKSTLLRLLIQRRSHPKHTHRNIPNNVRPNIRASCRSVTLTTKLISTLG